jgi:hypothetical protein
MSFGEGYKLLRCAIEKERQQPSKKDNQILHFQHVRSYLPTREKGRANTAGSIVGNMATSQLELEQACVELRHP